MNKPETTTEPVDETSPNSRKREITATVVSVGVALVLGAVTTGVINKFALRVRETIAPPADKTEEN